MALTSTPLPVQVAVSQTEPSDESKSENWGEFIAGRVAVVNLEHTHFLADGTERFHSIRLLINMYPSDALKWLSLVQENACCLSQHLPLPLQFLVLR